MVGCARRSRSSAASRRFEPHLVDRSASATTQYAVYLYFAVTRLPRRSVARTYAHLA